MSVAVITSIYGDFDVPKVQPPQTVDAEWILVTDREVEAPGWKVVVEPRPHMHPCLAAKVAKCVPSLYTGASTTVWMDGSLQLLREDSLEQIIAGSEGQSIAQIEHPARDCIYDEAEFCVPIPKYAGQPMIQQVDHYRKLGHPAHWGLYATGLIVRNSQDSLDRLSTMTPEEDEEVKTVGQEWLIEQMRWSFQDQLSEVFLLRQYAVPMTVLPFPLHGSGLFEWHAGHH